MEIDDHILSHMLPIYTRTCLICTKNRLSPSLSFLPSYTARASVEVKQYSLEQNNVERFSNLKRERISER